MYVWKDSFFSTESIKTVFLSKLTNLFHSSNTSNVPQMYIEQSQKETLIYYLFQRPSKESSAKATIVPTPNLHRIKRACKTHTKKYDFRIWNS